MKKGFTKSVSFKLMVLLITIIITLVTASFLFNNQIDKLKRQIDNIYFGNFVPVLNLQNIVLDYKDMVICIKDKRSKCSTNSYKTRIAKNWDKYYNGYKTDAERAVVNKIDKDLKTSIETKSVKRLNQMIQKVDFLIKYEIDEAYKQRRSFLDEYKHMKKYLFYNIIAIVVFSFAIIIYIIYTIIKKDSQLTILTKKYKMESITDSMTMLYNRHYFDTIFDNLPKISNANNWSSAFIMFDIDFFKQYNDTYGHDMGDVTLKAVALELKKYFNKEYEYVFRLGGEEFGAILFDIDKPILEQCLKDINQRIMQLQIEHKSSKVHDVVTISTGAVIFDSGTEMSANRLYKMADENLYKSKQNGRNQYTIE